LSAVREESTEVDWATVNGAAVGGEDFSAASGVLSIPAGATQGTITVLVSGDQVFEPKETFSVRLTAPRGASLGDAEGIGTILNDDLRPGTTDLRAFFDFGTPTSPVAAGYERVSQQTGYVADRGYGWQSGDIRSVSRSGWGALDTDLNYTPDGTFVVDLPVGAYSVDLILGDRGSYAHDSMGVYLEGALMETVTSGSRQVLSRHYEVEVADGQLTLQLRDLGGRDKNVCIEAMRIISAEAAPQHGPGPLWPTLPELPGAWFSEPVRDANGFLVYTVESQYQASATKIRVLLPTNFTWDQVYPTVYVLPVEAGEGRQYGDGLVTVRDLGLQNVHDAIFVAPTFSNLPWYADHVSNSKIWQETYFRTVVVPFIEHQYPTPESAEGRLLLGFSKSGQGAFAMLLRHPDYFGRVVAWDSALAMSDPSTGYGYLNILGSRANFENYRITSLLQARASELKNQPTRLFLRGYSYDYTRSDHATVDRLMTQLGIPHDYRDGVYRRHVWNSGWVPEAVDLLFS
jgi:hypothetical protein